MFAFCNKCRDMVKYTIKTIEGTAEVKGEEIKYNEKIAVCNECGEHLYVGEMMDENLDEIDKVYRREKELITIAEIEAILDKYDIGKKPLSNLLGWGEVTVTRYIDSQLPNKQYSDELYEILNNPRYMREVLEKNKSKITGIGYRKVDARLKDLDCVTSEDLEGLSKIEIVSEYIISLTGDITPLALQKILYYTQGFFSAFVEEYLFEEDCEAWAHGPVYGEIYHKYKDYRFEPIDKCDVSLDVFEKVLNGEEIEIVNSVVRNFGRYSGKMLEEMTHFEAPWREARGSLKKLDRSRQIIEKSSIKEYFEEVIESYKMINILDIKDYTIDIVGKIAI